MKKAALACLLLAGGLFAGCSGDSDKEHDATRTVFTDLSSKDSIAPITRLTDEEREDLYLEAIRDSSEGDYFIGVSDELLLETGYNVCKALDMGKTPEDLFMDSIDAGVPGGAAGAIVGAASAAFCPEYKDMMTR